MSKKQPDEHVAATTSQESDNNGKSNQNIKSVHIPNHRCIVGNNYLDLSSVRFIRQDGLIIFKDGTQSSLMCNQSVKVLMSLIEDTYPQQLN